MITKTTRATSSHSWITCVICQSECWRCIQPSTKVIFPFRWGPVILPDDAKLTKPLRISLIATAKREEFKSGLVLILPRLRDGCSMTHGVVCTGSFFVSICLLLHPRPTSIRKELAQARNKEDLKAVGKLVDLLEDIFTNLGKEDAVFTSLSTGIEVMTYCRPRERESKQRMTLY